MTWPGHERGSAAYRRILIALLCSGVATFAQLYSPQSLLPLIATDLGVSAAASSLIVSAGTLGLAVSVLPWSLVADRLGRVGAMRIALIAATALGLVFPWLPWFESVVALRFVQGVALGGIPGVTIVYLAEEIRSTRLALAAGTYISGTTVGGLLGRFIAAPIGEATNWRIGTFAVAALSVVMVATFIAVLPRARGFQPRATSLSHVSRAIGAHMRNPKLLVLYGQAVLLMGAFIAVYNYFLFRVEGPPFFITPAIASFMYLAYLAGTVSSRASARLVARIGRGPAILTCIGIMAGGALVTLSSSLLVMIVGLVVFTGGFFAAHTVAVAWSGTRASHDRAQSAALYNFGYYAGSSLFGFLGGFAWAWLGWTGVVAMVFALILVAGAWIALAARER